MSKVDTVNLVPQCQKWAKEALKQNRRANELSNVIPAMFAVSDRSRTEPFVELEKSEQHRLKNLVNGVTGKY